MVGPDGLGEEMAITLPSPSCPGDRLMDNETEDGDGVESPSVADAVGAPVLIDCESVRSVDEGSPLLAIWGLSTRVWNRTNFLSSIESCDLSKTSLVFAAVA